jgi:outer membrane protein assembly factor BamB
MSPLVDGDKCFVHVGGRETGTVAAFNASSGEKLWELKGHPSTYSSPVIMKLGSEKVLVVQTETDLIGVSMDGKLLWKTATPGERRFYNSSTPVINGQNIIIAGQGLGTKSFKVEKMAAVIP